MMLDNHKAKGTGHRLPPASRPHTLICIDAYHDDLEDRMAAKGKRR